MPDETFTIIAYGTLMSGECNHGFCRDALSIRPCTVRGTLYDTGWGYPAFVPEGDGIVRAELITLPAAAQPKIDRLEECPALYRREITSAVLPDGTFEPAWIYFMNRLPPQAKLIPAGDWKQRNRYDVRNLTENRDGAE